MILLCQENNLETNQKNAEEKKLPWRACAGDLGV
jgi:hypothetical protein